MPDRHGTSVFCLFHSLMEPTLVPYLSAKLRVLLSRNLPRDGCLALSAWIWWHPSFLLEFGEVFFLRTGICDRISHFRKLCHLLTIFYPLKKWQAHHHTGQLQGERESACELPSSSDLLAPVNLIGSCSITSHRCDDHIDSSRVHQMPAFTDQSEEILCLLDASSLSWKRLSYRIFGYRVVRKKILIMLKKMESNGEASNAQSSSKPRIIKAPQGHCVGQVS
jgi:hypothetical protein